MLFPFICILKSDCQGVGSSVTLPREATFTIKADTLWFFDSMSNALRILAIRKKFDVVVTTRCCREY